MRGFIHTTPLLVLCVVLSNHGVWLASGFVAPKSLVQHQHRQWQLSSSVGPQAPPPGIAAPTATTTTSTPPPGIAKPKTTSRYAPQRSTAYRYDPSKETSSHPETKSSGFRYDPNSRGPEVRNGPKDDPRMMMDGPEMMRREHPNGGGGRPEYVPYYSYTKPIQGAGSREYWEASPERTLVNLGSARPHSPVEAEVELWQGPNNTPQHVRTWSMDGWLRPFQAEFETSSSRYGGYPGTMQVRNTGAMEFPAVATVEDTDPAKRDEVLYNLRKETIDGGALRTFQFDHSVDRVRVHLQTDGLPLMAVVELWQGPNNVQQVAEVYVDDGRDSPFTTVIETPGYEFTGMSGSSIAIRNVGPIAYPIKASLEPIGRGGADTSNQQRPPLHENPPFPNRRGPYGAPMGRGYSQSHSNIGVGGGVGRGPYAAQGMGYPQDESMYYSAGRGPYAAQGKGYIPNHTSYHDGRNPYTSSYGGRTPPYLNRGNMMTAPGAAGDTQNRQSPPHYQDTESPQNLSNVQATVSNSGAKGIYSPQGAAGSTMTRNKNISQSNTIYNGRTSYSNYNGKTAYPSSPGSPARQAAQHQNPYNHPNSYYSTPSKGSPERDPRWYENERPDGYCNVFNQN